jgi:signal peptidase I
MAHTFLDLSGNPRNASTMTTDLAAARPSPRLGAAAREVLDAATHLAVVVAVFVVVQFLVFKPFTIPSSSMEPGLETGDYVIATSFDYGWSRAALPFAAPLFHGRLFERPARRGDVVVFRLPRDPHLNYVKRVIGVPGDRVAVRGGRVFINGEAVPARDIGSAVDKDSPQRPVDAVEETRPNGATYVTFDAGAGHAGDDTRTFLVPAGHYFMMGDNRDNSLDSRWPRAVGVGFVPAENLVGKARLIVASWKPGASLFKPWTWARLKPGRFLKPVR